MVKLGLSMGQLYDLDYALWLDQTLEYLRSQDTANLDWEHLTEEIEALGKELRHKVDSYLRQVLIHLLLYKYWIQERVYCGKGWQDEIDNFRYELELLFESKTLYNYFLSRIDLVYPKARKKAILKSELSPNIFPEKCPFSSEEILDTNFFPGDI